MGSLLATLLLAAAPAKPVVAVLYFDNDSGDKELDVLQKGLADMLVTDLAGTDQVTVVERQKLQKLIEELELQKSKYFDPATALKLGRGIGATHAVTGSFHSFEPKLRIDVRLVEIATSKVVLAESVTGTKAGFFELEQQLARRFLGKLDAKLGGAPKTSGADFDTVVAYSKGLDAQDRGELDAASRALADVARKSPLFALANQRQRELLGELEALAQKRGDVLFGQSDELIKNADTYFATHDAAKLKPDGARTWLAYRLVRSRYVLMLLDQRLGKGKPRAALDGKAKDVTSLLQSLFANEDALAREAKLLAKPLGTATPTLPAADAQRAKTLGLALGELPDPLDAPRLVFEGKLGELAVWPPLAMLDSRACAAAEALADAAAADFEAQNLPDRAVEAIDLKARGLFTVGRSEEASTAWKSAMQRFPASPKYRQLEARVRDAAGLTPAAKQKQEDQRWLDRARKACVQDELSRVGAHAGAQRAAVEGLHGWRRTVAELDQACGANPGLSTLYVQAARAAAAAGDCGFYDKLTQAMERVDRSAAWSLKGEVHCDPEGSDVPAR